MKLGKIARRVLTLCLAAALLSCRSGGDDDPAPPPPPPPPPGAGLDQRPSNLTCVAPTRVTGNSTLSVERAFPNLTFLEPVAMLQAPGDSSRWFVVEQNGIIRVFANQQTVPASQVFMDIEDRVWTLDGSEAGLLGLAFHPNFPANNRVFVNYSGTPDPTTLSSVTSEFTSPDGGLTIDPTFERNLLSVNKDFDNHNGGQLAFGPTDGLLYVGLGDGGGGNDPSNNAQNPQRLLGKMLRIDVGSQPGGAPYAIPADNMFANNARCNVNGTGTASCPEIYALGLRNPWRWSFDPPTGQLWLGDVGQRAFEEIDLIVPGLNYGWDIREGFECAGGGTSCSSAGFTNPVAAYGRAIGFSITGGHVYRGTQTTELVGRYVFGDFGGMIASLTPGAGGTFTITPMVNNGQAPAGAPGPLAISAFGRANDGELFALDYTRGHIYRLIFNAGGGGGGDNVPQQLSATGCINTTSAGAPPLNSLIPYTLNAPFWSDGAAKERWIGLPNGQNIAVPSSGDWEPPNGTVLVKHFRLGTQLVETRLFMRHPDGVWAGYTYQWNGAQTDATRITGGGTATVGNQTWIFPSEAQCMQCHTQAAGFSLGLETAQQNRDHTYPQTGRTANQITTLNAVNVLAPPIAPNPPAYADPADTSRSLNDRARAYLHTNCANCHRPQGPTPTPLDLRHDTALSQTGACDVVPTSGDLGIANARIIAPGDDARSVLFARMSVRDATAMPPLASNVVDSAGAQLIGAWIDSLTSC